MTAAHGLAAFLAAGPENFLNSTFSNFWFVLVLKVILLMGLFLTAPLAFGDISASRSICSWVSACLILLK